LDIPYTEDVQQAILRSSSPSNPGDRAENRHLFHTRDSRANVDNWRRRLTPAEIERVRTRVADVSPLFYGDDEW
jgi:hypothetical protein